MSSVAQDTHTHLKSSIASSAGLFARLNMAKTTPFPQADFCFPNDPLLVRLLEAAERLGGSEVIIEDFTGLKKTYLQLLADVLETRDKLRCLIPASHFDERGLLRDENLFITALTRTGYQYVVAFYAVRALGGAYTPLGMRVRQNEKGLHVNSRPDPRASVERQASVIARAKADCVLFDKGCTQELERLRSYLQTTEGKTLVTVPIPCDSPALPRINVRIDDSLWLDPDGPGYVCMTSGTTGYSKGVVIRRTCLTSHPIDLTSEPLEEQGGAQVNYNESHWLGGAKNVIESIALGKKVFALECPASARAVLDCFQHHRITYFIFNPAILRGMRDILLGDEPFTREKQETFSTYFSGLKFFLCIGGLVDQPTVDFWEAVIGHPLQNRYGASELTGLVTTGLSKINVSDFFGIPANILLFVLC